MHERHRMIFSTKEPWTSLSLQRSKRRLVMASNHHLVMAARELEGREASPSAGVIDSQSVKTTESGGVRGLDAGKKVRDQKRHITTDTSGFLVHACRKCG